MVIILDVIIQAVLILVVMMMMMVVVMVMVMTGVLSRHFHGFDRERG
jgi:hypothetical protein